jgi:hypothetical protein
MHKYLPILLLTALCGACSDVLPTGPFEQDEINETSFIAFSNAVDASPDTRSLTDANFTSFYVYGGYWSGSGWSQSWNSVFHGRRVDKNALGAWDYDNHERWQEGMHYKFYALGVEGGELPAGVTTNGFYVYDESVGVGRMHYPMVISRISVDDTFQHDLVYAESPEIVAQREGWNAPVALTFSHILSRIAFRFTLPEGAVMLSDVHIDYFFSTSSYEYFSGTVTKLSWSPYPDTESRKRSRLTLRFGGATEAALTSRTVTTDEAFVIPFDYTSAYATGMGLPWDVRLNYRIDYADGTHTSHSQNFRPVWEEGKSYVYTVSE